MFSVRFSVLNMVQSRYALADLSKHGGDTLNELQLRMKEIFVSIDLFCTSGLAPFIFADYLDKSPCVSFFSFPLSQLLPLLNSPIPFR